MIGHWNVIPLKINKERDNLVSQGMKTKKYTDKIYKDLNEIMVKLSLLKKLSMLLFVCCPYDKYIYIIDVHLS